MSNKALAARLERCAKYGTVENPTTLMKLAAKALRKLSPGDKRPRPRIAKATR